MPTLVNLVNPKKEQPKKTVLTACLQASSGYWATPETHAHVRTDLGIFSKIVYLGKHNEEDLFACYEERYSDQVFLFKGVKGDDF